MNNNALELFRELEARFRHPLRGRGSGEHRTAFRRANEELWCIAQRLAAEAEPQLQAKLDRLRRDVIRCLTQENSGNVLFKPVKMHRPIRWCEYLLTPELEGNLALTGSRVPFKLARELQKTHREQIQAIKRAVEL